MRRGIAGVLGILTVSISVSFAAAVATADSLPIEGLLNTGVDEFGNVLATGQLEQNYTMTGPSAPARVIAPHPLYVAAPAGAAWIGPASGNITSPDGDYTYSIMFDMKGLDVATAMISAQVSSDNRIRVLLNDNLVNFDIGSEGYRFLTDLLIEDGFESGLNTLSFVVTNEPHYKLNPTGLLIANLSGSAMGAPPVPEPSTAALLVLGIAGLAATRRRQ
jgi:hypothetical protein